jgi:Holliday junction resolvase RusA-like endonuclease
MKRIAVRNGKPVVYEEAKLANARCMFCSRLAEHAPKKPLTGPIYLQTVWLFPTADKKKQGKWKTTKPDTDNLLKLFKDCMTATGYWKDDAQVVDERTMKQWANEIPGIFVQVLEAQP